MQKQQKIILGLVGLGAAVFLGLFFWLDSRGEAPLTSVQAAEIEMTATQSDQAGVALDSQFMIQADGFIDPQAAARGLTVEPALPLQVTAGKRDGELLIAPDGPLAAGQVYRFTLNLPEAPTLQWAFQTKSPFRVTETLPRDKATGVPVNTGIEVSFSHSGFNQAEDLFQISPQVKGRFEIHKKTLSFVPESLEPSTIYTVTVQKGVRLAGSTEELPEDYRFSFETGDLPQENGGGSQMDIIDPTMEFTRGDTPLVALGYYDGGGDRELPPAEVTVYRYPAAADYITGLRQRDSIPLWAYSSRSRYREDPAPLSKVTTFSAALQRSGYETLLPFPAPLPGGFYLADIVVGDHSRQLWFQVTDLGLYALEDQKTVQAWAHDLKSGQPAAEARVFLAGSSTFGLTDRQGLVNIPRSEEEDGALYLLAQSGGQETVLPLLPQTYGPVSMDAADAADRYWKYLYLDRGLYRPGDTLRCWGFLRGREADTAPAADLRLVVSKWQDWQAVDVLSQAVSLEGYSFTTDVPLPNLLPGNYDLQLREGDQVLLSQWFTVQDYSKPAYRLTATPSQKAVLAGQALQFAVAARCFEDTPVPGLSLNYSLDQSGQLRTDSQGNARLDYLPRYQRQDGSPVGYSYLYLNASLPEVGEISGGASVIVLNTDLEIKGEGRIEAERGHLDLQLNRLTVDKVNSGAADPWQEDAFLAGTAGRRDVKLTVYRQDWDKIEDGEYYNFISKQVEKRYRYEERRVRVAGETLRTATGGQASYTFPAEAKKSYWVEAAAADSSGNEAVTTFYLPGEEMPQFGAMDWYYLSGDWEDSRYQAGDAIRLRMKNQQTAVADKAGAFLFFQIRQGVQSAVIQDSGLYQAVFLEETIPNGWVRGVYFDGRYYHETPDALLAYDPAAKDLKITPRLDKKEYRPGDTVRLSLDVRDQRGRPVQAQVNLNLVDEALFALADQQVDLLRSLYGDLLGTGIITSASSHLDPQRVGGGAEQGGEGGGIRENFQDAAYFQTLQSSKNGTASTTFTVPDNLTSWRLTYQGVSEDLLAGSGAIQVKVRQPYFVDLVAARAYLTGDQPTIYLRSLGSELDADSQVFYTVRLEGMAEPFEKNFQQPAQDTLAVTLPRLPAGSFKLTVFGRSARGSQDALAMTLQVQDSFLVQEKVDHYTLSNQTRISNGAAGPTTLVFTDQMRSLSLATLQRLAAAGGMRLEEKMAARMAGQMLARYFPAQWDSGSEAPFDPLSYQTSSGGLAILPYSSPDLGLSAKAAALMPEAFDSYALARYFTTILNDPQEGRERMIVALWGLAALDQPVLNEIILAEKSSDLSVKEQLLLILANQAAGNSQPAAKTLAGLIKSHGQSEGTTLRIDSGQDGDDLTEATALAVMAAAAAGMAEADALQQYVADNQPVEILTYPQELSYLQHKLPGLRQEAASFTYTLNGETESVSLEAGEEFRLICPADQLATLRFSDIQGQVGVAARSQAPLEKVAESGVDDTVLSRSYQVNGKEVTSLAAGDLVKVKLSYRLGAKAPKGLYQVTDFLPAGLKIIEKTYRPDLVQENMGWPVEVAGQKAVFLVSGSNGSFHYYARVVSAGQFRAESAMIQLASTGRIYDFSPQGTVVIK